VLFSVVFVLAERKVSTPLLSFAYFKSPTHRSSVGAMFLMGAVVSGYVYFTSLYLQKVQEFGPLLTGLALIPATGTVILTSTFLTRRLLGRLGVKRMLLIGLTSIGAGQIWLSFLSLGGSYLTVLLPGMLLTAFGMGLAFPSASVGATTGVAQQQQGMVGGLFATSQQIGSAIGLALLATVAATRTQLSHGSLAAGYRLAYLVATGCILIAGILVATQLSHKACEAEFARQSREGDQPRTDALIRKG
jgi:MFS family permease